MKTQLLVPLFFCSFVFVTDGFVAPQLHVRLLH